jgi:hypothetical protein
MVLASPDGGCPKLTNHYPSPNYDSANLPYPPGSIEPSIPRMVATARASDVKFYRVYHIDAKGDTAGLTNFMALNDADACEKSLALMSQSKWPGVELWESARHVHCGGMARCTVSVPTATVWGRPYSIKVEQISTTVWRVTGIYLGETHQAQDKTEAAAIERWVEWAKHREN